MSSTNQIKAIVTRSQLRIEFDDDKKSITMDASGVTITSARDLTLTAKGAIKIDGAGAIAITAAGDVETKGLNVKHEAQIAFVGEGNATAELSASGQTTVKGAMVMIN